ncbi:hypothetical protein FIE12Z_5536 [Fusarium flagelliforme]|uniref:Uncharacterized protein n=1 Tax=Fusarium flagelliforme TaxID=2675880 RepID=A0A395MQN5_9HYPO|nr:hypothetical protein FIE12Z_5536 [Fusarium flagelliforme]
MPTRLFANYVRFSKKLTDGPKHWSPNDAIGGLKFDFWLADARNDSDSGNLTHDLDNIHPQIRLYNELSNITGKH